MNDDVVPRYLVLVNESVWGPEFNSEAEAIEYAEQPPPNNRFRSVEVVRSVLRLEIDSETGTMLEVGEKLKEQPIRARINGMPVTLTSIEFDPNGTLE
jgi:hypothetical protein